LGGGIAENPASIASAYPLRSAVSAEAFRFFFETRRNQPGEGPRVHHGKIAFLDQHLERLYEGMCLLLGEIWGYSTRWATAGSTGAAGAQKKL
jgi:hypothetical protein